MSVNPDQPSHPTVPDVASRGITSEDIASEKERIRVTSLHERIKPLIEAQPTRAAQIWMFKTQQSSTPVTELPRFAPPSSVITVDMIEKARTDDPWHFAANLNAMMRLGYCRKCGLVPSGCEREGCGAAATEWLDRPNCNGWWLWRERGSNREEKILIVDNGAVVANDDEWEQATGTPAEDHERGINNNYWEGTDTTQHMMPGQWRLAPQNEEIKNAGPC